MYVLDPHGTLRQALGLRITIIASSSSSSKHSDDESIEFKRPILCQEDGDDEVLLADPINDRMLIYTSQGYLRQVKQDDKLQQPWDAVWWNGTLYVSTWSDRKLTMFQ